MRGNAQRTVTKHPPSFAEKNRPAGRISLAAGRILLPSYEGDAGRDWLATPGPVPRGESMYRAFACALVCGLAVLKKNPGYTGPNP